MDIQPETLTEDEYARLSKGKLFPPTIEDAEKQGYTPYRTILDNQLAFQVPKVFLKPNFSRTAGANCGFMLDRNGNPVPTYYDPGTGTCTNPQKPPD